jgi:hypothetical protein
MARHGKIWMNREPGIFGRATPQILPHAEIFLLRASCLMIGFSGISWISWCLCCSGI